MEFIREQIKEKPINTKRIVRKLGLAALCGAVFALSACVVMFMFMPALRGALLAGNTESTEDTEKNSETETENSQTESESQTQSGTEPDTGNGETEPEYSLSIEDYQEIQDELYSIGNKVNKSVVTVTTVVSETDWLNNAYETKGQGSGVLVSEDDNYFYVLTEKKVIQDASHVRVTFIDGTSADATLLKYDGNTGITILTVEKRLVEAETEKEIAIADFGNSFIVRNGSIVIALGSSPGTNYSILTGNITSTTNHITTVDKNYGVFTTDIVAGENSSGILINTKGEIVGMVIQAFSGSQDISTLTAVPISEIGAIIDRLIDGKDIPYVGLYVSTVTNDISAAYEIPKGVFIKEVQTDSPAMFAGLQSGDVITRINGEEIYTDGTYSTKIGMLIPGTTCEITVQRQNGNDYIEINCEVEIGVLQ